MNQKKKTTQTFLFGIVLLVIGLVIGGFFSSNGDIPERVFYASAGGAVLFPHDTHTGGDLTCADCHHELISDDIETSCIECHHTGSFDTVEWDDEDNLDLHEEMASEEDTDSCLDCHDHSDLYLPVESVTKSSCAECHDECEEAAFPPANMGHNCTACHGSDDSGEVEACGSCHAVGNEEGGDAGRRADALHNRCNRCHLDLEKTTFMTRSTDDEQTVCSTCHMKQ